MEKKRTSALNIQTYVDPRLVADIVLSMQEAGIQIKPTYSNLLKRLLIVIHESWGAEHFEFVEDALSFLLMSGFSVAQLETPQGKERLRRVMSRDAVRVLELEETQSLGLESQPKPSAEHRAEVERLLEQATSEAEGLGEEQ